MTVRSAADGSIRLEGDCTIEDAEPLQRLLLTAPEATLDWRTCTAAHTAVVQILLAARPALRGPPDSAFLRDWIEPLLQPSGLQQG
jgi:hypothetical protein